MKYIVLLLLFFSTEIQGYPQPLKELPVAYKGRFRPFEAYERLWLKELHQNSHLIQPVPPQFLWKLHFEEQATKDLMVLNKERPIRQQLMEAGTSLKMLPSRYQSGEWYSLRALKLQYDHPSQKITIPISNFTLYSDAQFEVIRKAYLELEKVFSADTKNDTLDIAFASFAREMQKAYTTIQGQIYQKAEGKHLRYPSWYQLKAETLYYQLPLLEGMLIFYFLGLTALATASKIHFINFRTLGLFFIMGAFLIHTLTLALRCYILNRPPVSNMFETVIYVPWIAVFVGIVSYMLSKGFSALVAASLLSCFLISLVKFLKLDQALENVPAVLDSQYWLIIHVLLIVASYGLLCLSGLLGHFYLIGYLCKKEQAVSLKKIALLLQQTLYIGVTLLISGTLLGGIWAAQSWGRFWDWDPKESWAFISCCVYLIFIHAYRFHSISHFGLAIGSLIGLQVISFTWYGVNYILGTGLHSYGFGSGGEIYYYLFLGAETAFIFVALSLFHRKKNTMADV